MCVRTPTDGSVVPMFMMAEQPSPCDGRGVAKPGCCICLVGMCVLTRPAAAQPRAMINPKTIYYRNCVPSKALQPLAAVFVSIGRGSSC